MKFWTKNKSAAAPETPTAEPQTPPSVPPRRFPTVGDLLAMLGITFLAQILVGAVILLFSVLSPKDVQLGPEIMQGKTMFFAYTFSMLAALGGVLIYRQARGGRGSWAHFSSRGLNPMVLLWAFVLIMAIGVVLEPVLDRLPEIKLDLGRGVWTMLSVVVCAPILEELLCRGVVLGSLRAKYGTMAAWVCSALFFGVLHMQPAQVIGATAIGLVLGYVYIATDSLWATMILHALNNAAAFMLMSLGYENAQLIDLIPQRGLYLLVYFGSLGLAVISGTMMLRKLRQLKAEEKNRAEA